jgi:CBS domain-containing protein
MLRLQDIMTREVLSVSPELGIRETMELFATRHVSGAPVMSGNQVIGIVASSDLMSFAAERAQRLLDDIPEDVDEADDTFVGADDASCAYFVTLWGRESDGTRGGPEMASAGWCALGEHTVSEVMTFGPVRALPPGAGVDEAATLMCNAGVHRVLVMDAGAVVGIVTTTDIVRAVAGHYLAP